MIKLLHKMFDGALYFNFYFSEKNQRELDMGNMYIMIWGISFYLLLGIVMTPIFIYINLFDRIPQNRVGLGLFIVLCITLIDYMQIRHLKKIRFVENLLADFLKVDIAVKKNKAKKGFFFNILPFILAPLLFLLIMKFFDK